MSNIGKRVRIKNYFTDYNGRTGIITSLNSSGIVYCVDFDDGKKPLSCLPYIETHKYAQCKLIEEEFVLPAKWALKTNDDFKSWIRTWDKTNPSNKLNVDGTRWNEYYFNSDVKNTKTWKFLEYLPLGYTEISFEQFKQYVLKENKTEMKVGDKLSDYIFPQKLKAHVNSKGVEYQPGASTGGWYDLNTFSERYIKSIENGYFEVSGFGYGWFKLDEKITKKQTNMEKKIIGYKLVKPEYEQAAIVITNYSDDGKFKEWMLKSTGNFVERLKRADVLDLWFEPVFSEDYKIIIVGSNNTQVIVKQNGKIEFRGQYTEIQIVNALLKDFDIESRVIGTGWKTSIPKSIRFIQIGCDSESNKFSIEDLELIKKTYNSLK